MAFDDRNARYADRQRYHQGETVISDTSYNLVLGGTLFYGFLINCFMVAFLSDSIIDFVSDTGVGFYIIYAIMVIVGSLMVNMSKQPIVSFIGYNFIVVPLGMCLSVILTLYLEAGYSTIVATAFAITAIVTLVMMVVSTMFPDFFLSIGRTLGLSLLVCFVIEIVLLIVGAPLAIMDYIVVLIFCGYIGYDWARANACIKTVDNAIDSACELYVDIINLFIRILRILARNSRN